MVVSVESVMLKKFPEPERLSTIDRTNPEAMRDFANITMRRRLGTSWTVPAATVDSGRSLYRGQSRFLGRVSPVIKMRKTA